METKTKVEHLANWYFGNFCAMKYAHARKCYDELQEIAKKLQEKGIKEMIHKEFCIIARENLTCKPIIRDSSFDDEEED